MNIQNLKIEDFDNQYLNLLEQLTTVNKHLISKNDFIDFVQSLNQYHRVLVLKDNEKIVGTITLLIEKKLIHNCGRVAHIEDVVVHKDYRGQNLGKLLIQKALNISREFNCYKVILDCDQKNIKFYEKCGFSNKGAFMTIYL